MKKLEKLNSKKFEKMSLIKGGKLAASFGLGTDPETGCVDNPDKCTAKDNDPCGDTASVPAP
ncbi:hypothetical protein SAMN05216324_105113 [Chryseobacterium limigenitum]|uniref:Uncharacterized protein n=1 Tax=Chryseobacterium limigenitum TaxID=1612149 RepID=A0A1K2IM25_9FLAO|nr:hypothetical protein SAMN05216324_105113 [Chryseobacterium limigenitum]